MNEPKLLIFHLITSLDVGGAEKMLVRLAADLKMVPEVRQTVITLKGPGVLSPDVRKAGIRCIELGIASPWQAWKLLRLVALLRKEKPDVLQTWLYHSDIVGAFLRPFFTTTRLIWNLRYSSVEMQHYSLLSRLTRAMSRWLSHIPDAIIVNSQRGLRVHQELNFRARRWIVIPNGFDVASFRRDEGKRSKARASLGVPGSVKLIGTLGRWDAMKDYSTLLHAVKLLKALRPQKDWKVVLGGRDLNADNPQLREIFRTFSLTSEDVLLLGPQSDPVSFYSGLDLMTLSSVAEGFPNVVAEAMCCGLPVVTTDVGDVASWLTDRGWVVPVRDPQALAQAWNQALDTSLEVRKRLGESGRKFIESHFDMARTRDEYYSFYRLMTEPSTRSRT